MHFLLSLRKSPLAVAVLAFASVFAAAPRTAHAEALLLIEAESGKVLQAENATYPWYPASVTKLMTAYVTLKAVKDGRLTLDTLLTVSPAAAAQSPSKMGLRAGTQVTVDNALKMMMVKSANDMAVVLAEGVGGSIDGFSAEMNKTAQQLGMTQTSYVNPNGLPADGQITSARDLAILARAIIYNIPEYEYFVHIPSIRFGRRVTQNFNKLIGRYPGADGMKTGFICASGYNLVATATRNGRRLIAVVLGASSGTMRAVRAAQLLERGFAANSLSWLTPALGTVNNLAPIDASPPNLRDEMCGGKHKRPASDEDESTIAGIGQRGRRNQLLVFHRRAAAAELEAVGIDGGGAGGLATGGGLYRTDEIRRRADRRQCRRRREANGDQTREEVAGRGPETGSGSRRRWQSFGHHRSQRADQEASRSRPWRTPMPNRTRWLLPSRRSRGPRARSSPRTARPARLNLWAKRPPRPRVPKTSRAERFGPPLRRVRAAALPSAVPLP